MSIRIIVATNKPYHIAKDKMYLPIQVGAAQNVSIGFRQDDEGENISLKNAHYCELTGLFWAWKNLDADYIGLCHYRRYLSSRKISRFFTCKSQRILTLPEAEKLLIQAPILLPKKRSYWIETTYSQYVHAHYESDLVKTKAIIEDIYPEYKQAFDKVMSRRSGHHFNMFVMRRDLLERYCEWLFDILFELEKRVDISGYSTYNQRLFGFIGERLLDVWLAKESFPYLELPVVFMEKQHWPKKILNFLWRKFRPVNPFVGGIV